MVFGVPAFLTFARDFDLWLAGLIALGLAAVVGVFQFLSWWRFTYELTDDALVQAVFHQEQLLALALHHLGHGNPGRA